MARPRGTTEAAALAACLRVGGEYAAFAKERIERMCNSVPFRSMSRHLSAELGISQRTANRILSTAVVREIPFFVDPRALAHPPKKKKLTGFALLTLEERRKLASKGGRRESNKRHKFDRASAISASERRHKKEAA